MVSGPLRLWEAAPLTECYRKLPVHQARRLVLLRLANKQTVLQKRRLTQPRTTVPHTVRVVLRKKKKLHLLIKIHLCRLTGFSDKVTPGLLEATLTTTPKS